MGHRIKNALLPFVLAISLFIVPLAALPNVLASDLSSETSTVTTIIAVSSESEASSDLASEIQLADSETTASSSETSSSLAEKSDVSEATILELPQASESASNTATSATIEETSTTIPVNQTSESSNSNTSVAKETLATKTDSSQSLAPLRSPMALMAIADFVTEAVNGGLKIIGWNGTDTDLLIPDEIDGQPVLIIGSKVFQKKGLHSVTLGKNVRQIESYAFADNLIGNLIIPGDSALTRVGDYAFVDNNLSSLNLPAQTESIGVGAFSRNVLSSVSLNDTLQSLANSAFEANFLKEVSIGSGLVSFGERVFADNQQFVNVHTTNSSVPAIQKYEGAYGHVVNAIKILVTSIDKSTNQVLVSEKVLGDDLSDSNNVFVLNQELQLIPDEIPGYAIKTPQIVTPTSDPYRLTLAYTPTTIPPQITPVKPLIIAPGTDPAAVEGLLLAMVEASDLLGDNISSGIIVNMGDLDPAQPGTYEVTFSVTDRFGNTTNEAMEVFVGTDWLAYPIWEGWVLGDFTYTGSIVTGLSPQGKTKLNNMTAPRTLVLPCFSPYGDRPAITEIGGSAFASYLISPTTVVDNIDFRNMANLEKIGNSAFISIGISSLNYLDQASRLTTIEKNAFSSNKIGALSFTGLGSLTRIEESAFSNNKISNLNFDGFTKRGCCFYRFLGRC